MRRIYLVALALMLLGACSSSEKSSEPAPTATEPATAGAVAPAPPAAETEPPAAQPATDFTLYPWYELTRKYNKAYCEYVDEETSDQRRQELRKELQQLKEQLDQYHEKITDVAEKQAFNQAMTEMVNCP